MSYNFSFHSNSRTNNSYHHTEPHVTSSASVNKASGGGSGIGGGSSINRGLRTSADRGNQQPPQTTPELEYLKPSTNPPVTTTTVGTSSASTFDIYNLPEKVQPPSYSAYSPQQQQAPNQQQEKQIGNQEYQSSNAMDTTVDTFIIVGDDDQTLNKRGIITIQDDPLYPECHNNTNQTQSQQQAPTQQSQQLQPINNNNNSNQSKPTFIEEFRAFMIQQAETNNKIHETLKEIQTTLVSQNNFNNTVTDKLDKLQTDEILNKLSSLLHSVQNIHSYQIHGPPNEYQNNNNNNNNNNYNNNNQNNQNNSGYGYDKYNVEKSSKYNIRVFRFDGACPSFESNMENELNKILEVDAKSRYLGSFRSTPTVTVKTAKGIDSVEKDCDMLILLCFTATVRIEAQSVLPMYREFQKARPNLKIICVVLRYGENAVKSMVVDTSKDENDVVLDSFSIHFNNSGLLSHTNTLESLHSIKKLLKD